MVSVSIGGGVKFFLLDKDTSELQLNNHITNHQLLVKERGS